MNLFRLCGDVSHVETAARGSSRTCAAGMLFAAGATFPPSLSNTTDPYLQTIRAFGFPVREKAHRQALATKFAAKAFPRLPTEVAAHVVAFSFHVGYY